MPDVTEIRSEVAKIKMMVTELYDRPIVSKPIVETVIPIIHVTNIWEVPVEVPVREIREERHEKKRKRKEDKAAKKRARVDNIQDERDRK